MNSIEPPIRKTPQVMGGEACVRHTRIGVWILVQARKLGISDDQLLADYPGLTTDDLDAAWDYYRGQPAEIERAIWFNDTAPNHDVGTPIPTWVLVSGLLLGIAPDEIREAFDTPMTDAELTAAWAAYRADPAGILMEVSRHRLAG
jgi:uncharacterized protein (DUF433 family)